jgi:hypothetical protein
MSIYDHDLLSYLAASPSGDYLSIFSTLDLAGNTSVYNTNLWGGGGINANFTCVGHRVTPASTYYCKLVAISKRHAIRTQHTAVTSDIGSEWAWIAADGTRTVRTVIDNIDFVAGTGDGTTDFHVVYFDQDLPDSINLAPLNNDTSTTMTSQPVIRTNQFGQAATALWAGFSSNTITFSQPGSTPLSTYWVAWVTNDSGSPAFTLNGSQLIYLTSAVTATSGPATLGVLASIVVACSTLDGRNDNTGYTPTLWNPADYRGARTRALWGDAA